MARSRLSGRVLVLGEDAGIVLSVVRSLGRAGLSVDVGWCSPGPAMRSRYIRDVRSLAWYSPGSDDWRKDLLAVARAGFEMVLPVTDAAILPIQAYAAGWPPDVPFYLLGEEASATFFSKERTGQLASRLGIPVPRTVLVERTGVGLAAASRQIGFPAVVKPVRSVSEADLYVKNVARVVWNEAELADHTEYLLARGQELLLQEWCAGVGVGVDVLAYDGEILFAMQHERLHETIGYGSTYRRTVPLDRRLLDAAARMLSAVRHTGVAMVEFRRDPTSQRWVLLEVNARFWGSLPLAIAAGADFPRFLYEMTVQGRRQFPGTYRVGVRGRSLLQDARWTWRVLRGRSRAAPEDRGWATAPVPRWHAVRDLVRMVSRHERLDTLALDDPWPFVAEVGSLCRLASVRVRQGPPA